MLSLISSHISIFRPHHRTVGKHTPFATSLSLSTKRPRLETSQTFFRDTFQVMSLPLSSLSTALLITCSTSRIMHTFSSIHTFVLPGLLICIAPIQLPKTEAPDESTHQSTLVPIPKNSLNRIPLIFTSCR